MTGQSVPSASLQMTKPGGVADRPEGCAAIQRDLYRLEKCAVGLGASRSSTRGSAKSCPGEKQPQAPGHAGGHPAGKQPGRK